MKNKLKITPQKLTYLEQTGSAITHALSSLCNSRPIEKSDIIAALALADFYLREYRQLLVESLRQEPQVTSRKPKGKLGTKTDPAFRLIFGGKYRHGGGYGQLS